MYKLPNSAIKKWTKHGDVQVPVSINTICPHCGEKGTFSTLPASPTNEMVSLNATCPTCDKKVYFVIVSPQKSADSKEKHSGLYIIPAPKMRELLV